MNLNIFGSAGMPSRKKTMESRRNKVELASQLTKNTYKKESLSWNAKIRHYTTVIKPEALYAAETLSLTNQSPIEMLEIKERKILRKILSLKFHNNKIIHVKNETLYQRTGKFSDSMRKRRIDFYGHILRMNPNRLTKEIFDYFCNKKTKPKMV